MADNSLVDIIKQAVSQNNTSHHSTYQSNTCSNSTSYGMQRGDISNASETLRQMETTPGFYFPGLYVRICYAHYQYCLNRTPLLGLIRKCLFLGMVKKECHCHTKGRRRSQGTAHGHAPAQAWNGQILAASTSHDTEWATRFWKECVLLFVARGKRCLEKRH